MSDLWDSYISVNTFFQIPVFYLLGKSTYMEARFSDISICLFLGRLPIQKSDFPICHLLGSLFLDFFTISPSSHPRRLIFLAPRFQDSQEELQDHFLEGFLMGFSGVERGL